jgi:hypothetical protein
MLAGFPVKPWHSSTPISEEPLWLKDRICSALGVGRTFVAASVEDAAFVGEAAFA